MQGRKFVWAAVLMAAVVTAVAGSATAAEQRSKAVTLNLVAYSTPKPVMTKIISDFQDAGRVRRHDQRVVRSLVGAGEGRVRSGLPADIVLLNTGNDMNDLVDKGLINKNWDKQSYKGVAFNSVVVFGAAERQPEEDQGLERPAQARRRDRQAEPVHRRASRSGTSSPPTRRSARSGRTRSRRRRT